MKKKKIIIGILIFLIVVSVLFIVGVKKKEKAVLKILSDKVDLYVKDFHYTEVGDPDFTWEINADSAKFMKKEKLVLLENVRAKLVASDGAIYFMTGKEGRFRTDIKDIDISENVVIVSDNGDRFTTDYLKYSYSDKRIHTTSRVTMENSRIKLRGVGLSVSLDTKKLTILSNVSAHISDFSINPR